MIKVTDKAKEKLRSKKEEVTTSPEVVIRMIRSPKQPDKLELVLHKPEDEDQVIKDDHGTKILVVEPSLAPELDGRTLDYKEIPEKGFEGFWISEAGS